MKPVFNCLSVRAASIVMGGALIATTLGLVVGGEKDGRAPAPTSALNVKLDEQPVTRAGHLAPSFAPVVKQVAPSVVQVYTTAKPRPLARPPGPGWGNPPFGWFFGPPGALPEGPMPRQQGMGSGVIVTEDGYILTNNHVVDGADEVKVALLDGREFPARVVGKDPKSDIAVLKVRAEGLPHITMADSDRIEVGDLVLAIGNPFGIGQTVTLGMVSARGRGGLGLDYEDFIQTDAAINPGNSGGALVDAEGRLIGINTAILSRSGGNQGIGFAIPTNLARYVMESIVTDGKVTRGYLGVIIQDVTPALARKLSLENQQGALVGDVAPKSPAAKAGVADGDVVTEFNGQAVKDSRHLKLLVAQAKPGQAVNLTVVRDGERKELKVVPAELPGSEDVARAGAAEPDEGTLNGVAVTDIDARSRRQFDIPADVTGALVSRVEPASAAAEVGLRTGDVILEINRQPVKSADEAVRLTAKAEDKTTLLRIWREGNRRFVVVDESEAD
jgi:serine protease Do